MAENVDVSKQRESHDFGRISAQLTQLGPTLILCAAAAFFAYDIARDLAGSSESGLHILVESIIFLAVTGVLFAELRHVAHLRRQVHAERDRRARLSGELLAAMNAQFSVWGLSPSESEVALLLIKGLSMKEIALIREVKEKTVRQQASAIYAKSGCTGRHEVAAQFIEDLIAAAPPKSAQSSLAVP